MDPMFTNNYQDDSVDVMEAIDNDYDIRAMLNGVIELEDLDDQAYTLDEFLFDMQGSHAETDDDLQYYDHFNRTYGYKLHVKQDEHPSKDKLMSIMELYHRKSTDKAKEKECRKQAYEQMLGVTEAYIHELINKRYANYKARHCEELEQQGRVGVLIGMRTFNPEKGSVTTWFSRFINHEMQDYINRQVNHSTPHYTSAAKKVFRQMEIWDRNNRAYNIHDLSRATDVPVKTINECIRIRQMGESTCFDDLSMAIGFNMAKDTPGILEQLVTNETTAKLRRLIGLGENGDVDSILTKEEQVCITMSYGLITDKRESPAAISRLTGIPQERIRSINNSAISKMKQAFNYQENGRKRKEKAAAASIT